MSVGRWLDGTPGMGREEERREKPPPDCSSIATATSPATQRNEQRMEERRGRTTIAMGRCGDAVDRCRCNLNTIYWYYIINPFVFNSSLCVLSSAPHPCNKRRPSAHFSCRPPRCRSPTPPIVTSYSAPRQRAPSVVLLLHRLRTSRTAPLGHDNRLPLHTSSS